jgi:orotidine-5'-phosphate decarboxylase
MHFADALTLKIEELQNPSVVGLDPRINQIPEFLIVKHKKQFGANVKALTASILEFNIGIIEAIKDIVPAVKPQIAFYEALGPEGVWVFEATCKYAKSQGMIVIADAKRNDIGSTCEAYAEAFLGEINVFGEKFRPFSTDAVTVTPYLGSDGINPFVKKCAEFGKGIFVLVKTSNPSSGELQDLAIGDEMVHEYLAQLVAGWGQDLIGNSGLSSVGAVVGATYPEEARFLRTLMPNTFFLVPGYGAQGGGAEDVKPCFLPHGRGAIVNSSRDIIFAYEKDKKYGSENFADAARAAAKKMKEALQIVYE